MNNSKSENLKKCADTMGRAGFLFETLVRLEQTGDHPVVKHALLDALEEDMRAVQENFNELKKAYNEQE